MKIKSTQPFIEFSGERSRHYRHAMTTWPDARAEDLDLVREKLRPLAGERIIELGSGTGYFTREIARSVVPENIVATDPSEAQMSLLEGSEGIIPIVAGADELHVGSEILQSGSFDAAFSFGALHHCNDKTRAFEIVHELLKPRGRVVIVDVLQGSPLSKHFDEEVARHCITGHEVSFLSREFAASLCHITGFAPPTFSDVVQRWRFNSRAEIGLFIFSFHAMTKSSPQSCLERAEQILGIGRDGMGWYLNWPLTVMTTSKI